MVQRSESLTPGAYGTGRQLRAGPRVPAGVDVGLAARGGVGTLRPGGRGGLECLPSAAGEERPWYPSGPALQDLTF